jgi:amphi-Trp domain-containing protein
MRSVPASWRQSSSSVSCCRNGRKVCTHRETAVPIAAGIDGEALLLDVPLEFRIRPKVLRVRVARQHPGASPSAMAPEGVGEAVDDRLRPAPESVEKINTKEVSMDLMEITEKERLSREDAAARLHALADALARHNEVEFERGSLRFKVHVPDEVDFKLEIEIGEDERELEVELTW